VDGDRASANEIIFSLAQAREKKQAGGLDEDIAKDLQWLTRRAA